MAINLTETRVKDPTTGGEKGSKPCQLSLAPPYGLMQLGAVYGFGCKKYPARNWEKGYRWTLSLDALHRHVMLFQAGEDNDPESGLPHLAHAAWHCMALMEWSRTHPELDDRSKPHAKEAPKE